MTREKELISKINSWIKDFEKTQPKNIQVDEDTFEGDAYFLFNEIKTYLLSKKK